MQDVKNRYIFRLIRNIDYIRMTNQIIMDINDLHESPLYLKISFNKLIEKYEEMAQSDDPYIAAKAKRIIDAQAPYPELRDGFTNPAKLNDFEQPISIILEDSFNTVLTQNEIKTASVPFHNLIFNSSERFKNIIESAGRDFEVKIKNMPEDDLYIIACTVIIKFCYGLDLSFKRPFFYEIPDENGILRYYKILYNVDFTEIIPTEKAKRITQEDVDELLDNYENIGLWKEKFPPNSYIFKGFVISNIFDVTDDQSISNIKSNLISENRGKDENFIHDFQEIFRSLLNIKDLQVGFSVLNKEDGIFERVYGDPIVSFLLNKQDSARCNKTLCNVSLKTLIKDKKFYAISDVDKYYELSKGRAPQYKSLRDQGFKSAILAPLANEDRLLGILELVSRKPKVLNSVNANRLIDIMPFMAAAVERSKNEEENLIEAVIQQECTSIHPSVHWKFRKEARAFIKNKLEGREPVFKKIVFEDVYPLFGQIDIKGSSMARNSATQKDLNLQLNAAKSILEMAFEQESLPIYEQIIYQTNRYLDRLRDHFQVDSEQKITEFFQQEISPLFYHLLSVGKFSEDITAYFNSIDEKLDVLYKHRKDYDDTISLINRKMAELLDDKQLEAQRMYPHFYERYKTDGVEHNLYIGESITKDENFNKIFLYNLRLWQLQVMIEMENSYYNMQHDFPVQLDVASMILVFNQPLSISFRMDEKHFDVDGTYNARYEIVKKRVDKAYIKGTTKRITEKGKITIVYSQKQDEVEYLGYVRFLQSKNYLDKDVEIVELEDLQAVTGLKAIRASVLYHKDDNDQEFLTYDDLMKELDA